MAVIPIGTTPYIPRMPAPQRQDPMLTLEMLMGDRDRDSGRQDRMALLAMLLQAMMQQQNQAFSASESKAERLARSAEFGDLLRLQREQNTASANQFQTTQKESSRQADAMRALEERLARMQYGPESLQSQMAQLGKANAFVPMLTGKYEATRDVIQETAKRKAEQLVDPTETLDAQTEAMAFESSVRNRMSSAHRYAGDPIAASVAGVFGANESVDDVASQSVLNLEGKLRRNEVSPEAGLMMTDSLRNLINSQQYGTRMQTERKDRLLQRLNDTRWNLQKKVNEKEKGIYRQQKSIEEQARADIAAEREKTRRGYSTIFSGIGEGDFAKLFTDDAIMDYTSGPSPASKFTPVMQSVPQGSSIEDMDLDEFYRTFGVD